MSGEDRDDALLDTLITRCLVGGGWALLTTGFALGMAVVRTFVVARLVGPEAFGVMTIALMTLATAEAFTSTGIESALVSHPDDPLADLDPAFTLLVLRGLLIAAVLWTTAPLVAAFFAEPGAAGVIRALCLVALLRGVANPGTALLVRRFEFARLFWWSVPEVLTGFTLAVGFAFVRRDVWALAIGAVGLQVMATIVSHVMVARRPRFTLRRDGVGRLIHYGKWVNGSRTLNFLSLYADTAIVGKVLGTSALGLYQLGFRIGELAVTPFTRAVVQVAFPALSQLQKNPHRLKRGYRSVVRLVLAANCAFAIGVVAFAGPLVSWLLGPRWLPMIPVLRILVIGMIFRAFVVVTGQLFEAVREPSRNFHIQAVRLGVLLISLVPLLHVFRMEGVAMAVLISSVVAAAMSLRSLRTLEHLREAA